MALPEPRPKQEPERDEPEKPKVRVSRWTIGFLIGAVGLLALLLWSGQRERESHVKVPDIDRFEEALPSIAGMTGSPILPGNSVQVLQNGELFPALLADIRAARRSVHLETYVWWQGEICRQVAEALADKARQGVEVRLTLDAVGTKKMDEELERLMRDAGVRVVRYHPFHLVDLGLFNNRTHRKVAVLDGRVAYVFGHGIADEWTGRGQDAEHWRDTGLRLEGQIAEAVQGVFAENWVEESGEVLVGEQYFPRPVVAGPVRTHLVASSPHGGVSELELLVKLAIASARRELLIQNPYFIPDEELTGLLGRAVRRGVAVRVMVPGAVTDSSVVRHAGHFRFDELLRAGIRIYEHRRTLVHQKVMVVDGTWSLVGSNNFDDRSFDINDEVSVGVLDQGVAAELRRAFAADLRHAAEIRYDPWSRRSWGHRLLDRVSYMLNEQL